MNLSNARNYICWALISGFYLFENCLLVSQGILGPSMQAELNLSNAQIAVMASAFYWSYALMQIPVGVILDKTGVKIPLLLAVAICVTGVFISANTSSFIFECLARILIGFGASFAVLSSLNFTAANFSKNKFATLTGLLLTIGMSGQILGEAPLLRLIDNIGWRSSLNMLTYIGLGLLVCLFLLLPKQKNQNNKQNSTLLDLKEIFKDKKYWKIAVYGMLRFTPFSLFAAYWGTRLIPKIHSLDSMQAATIVGMLPLGFAIGAPIWGFISDRSGKRLPVLIISNLLEIILWSMLFLHADFDNLNIIAGLLGFSISGFLPSFSLMKETAAIQIRSTALGFMNTLNSIATPMLIPVLSLINDRSSDKLTLLVLPLLALCAMISFMQLREAH